MRVNHLIISAGTNFRRLAAILFLAVVMAAGSGCRDREAVRAKLYQHIYLSNAALRLEIQAQITGPQTGLSYKWFSISGECDPQESTSPSTKVKFGVDAPRDRVSLEVWREDQEVATAQIDVELNDEQMRQAMERENGLKIQITNVPPYDLYGGTTTHAGIGGVVIGTCPPNSSVIIYARVADTWYIQPDQNQPLAISPDGTWSSGTHTGVNYAALLVKTNFQAEAKCYILPSVGGAVIARAVVEGVKK